jgi:hypothetical protein
VSRFLALISLSTLGLAAACGTSPAGTGGAAGSSTTSASGGAASTSSAGGAASTSAPGTGGATSTSSSSGAGGSAPIQSCGDINAADCFSNLDCPAADRCENQGTPDLAVPCCVPGPRGAGMLDDPCVVDDDCATSLCIETSGGYLCSGECAKDGDCPASMPTCTAIPPILGQGSFCLPT